MWYTRLRSGEYIDPNSQIRYLPIYMRYPRIYGCYFPVPVVVFCKRSESDDIKSRAAFGNGIYSSTLSATRLRVVRRRGMGMGPLYLLHTNYTCRYIDRLYLTNQQHQSKGTTVQYLQALCDLFSTRLSFLIAYMTFYPY